MKCQALSSFKLHAFLLEIILCNRSLIKLLDGLRFQVESPHSTKWCRWNPTYVLAIICFVCLWSRNQKKHLERVQLWAGEREGRGLLVVSIATSVLNVIDICHLFYQIQVIKHTSRLNRFVQDNSEYSFRVLKCDQNDRLCDGSFEFTKETSVVQFVGVPISPAQLVAALDHLFKDSKITGEK